MPEICLVFLICTLATGMLSPYVYYRNCSMSVDALSHISLLGIVLSFSIVKSLSSPFLILGTSIFALFSFYCIELLQEKARWKREESLGFLFPFFFALGIVLLSIYYRNVHLDTDMVLMGNPFLIPFQRMGGLPVAFWKMLFCLIINGSFLLLSYRPMKKLLFEGDEIPGEDRSRKLLHYALLFCIVNTAISSFDTVGGILTISLFVAPVSVARFYSKTLKECILYSMGFALLHGALALMLSFHYNLSLSGICAFIGMLDGLVQNLYHQSRISGIRAESPSSEKEILQNKDKKIINLRKKLKFKSEIN